MPPSVRISKDRILAAALALVREQGPDALNARRLAARLGCSTQPIFKNYASMEGLGEAVRSAAEDLWLERMHASQTRSDYPPYKALGMAYIAFAGEEPQLFRLLFMCDRSPEIQAKDGLQEWLPVVHDATGLEETDATMFHLEIWAFVHGIAVMHATHYLDLPEALVSRILTDTFLGLKHQWGDANVRDRNQSTDEKV